MGTRINILVERPGMVIGKSGNKIKELTEDIKNKFHVDNPQIEIQEAGSSASLNAKIMAEKLAEALERGWHFRRAGHSTVKRIIDAGAKGCQVVIAGKLTGERHRTEKFTEGHIKFCGETAKQVMDVGYASAKLKVGIFGIKVRIMRPNSKLPDEIKIKPREEEKPKEKVVEKVEEKKEPEVEKKKTDIKKLTEIKGIGPSIVKKFEKAGITSLEELYELDVDDLAAIEGIGEKTATNIIKGLRKIIEEVA
jgi:small subunit ribosomal protein S3